MDLPTSRVCPSPPRVRFTPGDNSPSPRLGLRHADAAPSARVRAVLAAARARDRLNPWWRAQLAAVQLRGARRAPRVLPVRRTGSARLARRRIRALVPRHAPRRWGARKQRLAGVGVGCSSDVGERRLRRGARRRGVAEGALLGVWNRPRALGGMAVDGLGLTACLPMYAATTDHLPRPFSGRLVRCLPSSKLRCCAPGARGPWKGARRNSREERERVRFAAALREKPSRPPTL